MKTGFKLILGRRRNYPLNIDLEVYLGKKVRVYVTTGIVLENDKQWDAPRQAVVKNTNAKQYNMFLQDMISNVQKAQDEAAERGVTLTSEEIRLAAKKASPFDGIDVVELFTKYVETSTLRERSKELDKLSIRKLYEFFCKKYGTKNGILQMSYLTKQFIEEFDDYLKSFGLTRKYDMRHHIAIRSFLKRAEKEGLINSNPYIGFDTSLPKSSERNALTFEQLRQLENYDRTGLSLNKNMVLDMFLLSCYTGLRLSDVSTLVKEEIHHDAKGIVIERVSIKTGIKTIHPLYSLFEGKGEAIVKKYQEMYPDSQRLFPHYDHSAVEKRLKIFGKPLNLNFPLSFHVSRHTCASLLAERLDNPFVIMNVLGHSDIETSMHYIHLSHKSAEKKLATVNWNEGKEEEQEYIPNEEATTITQDIQQTCEAKQISGLLTRLAMGVCIVNPDKATLVRDWISKIRKKDYSAEAFHQRLMMLVE